MLIDDRLATVLRSGATSGTSALTQFRQLIDLAGALGPDDDDAPEAAYGRLDELIAQLPERRLAAILREPGLRLRNVRLIARLARMGPHVAGAAMAQARLSEREWLYLIPRLPVTARGLLRHRGDLPFSARQVLERLGVRDLVLPGPGETVAAPAPETRQPAANESELTESDGIGALVRRIEAFRRARGQQGPAPRLPLGDEAARDAAAAFDFTADSTGLIDWATPEAAPLLVGMALSSPREGAVATLDEAGRAAMRGHLPLRGAALHIDAAAPIAGEWLIDAAPVFHPDSGAFAGYRGRMRRRPAASGKAANNAARLASDRIRQVLHELRTPVNAIQGFAEVIQQQVFGPAPNEYRAMAAAIAVDAARLMAGFDEMDRLARLQSGALALAPGSADMRGVFHTTLQRLEGVLRPRAASMALEVSGGPFIVPLAESDMLQLAWRLLATLAGSIGPGEAITLSLAGDGTQMALRAELPLALEDDADIFAATAPVPSRAISAGMFGTGFAFRLARAEAEAAGGALHRTDEFVELILPVLTGAEGGHSVGGPESAGASSG